MVDFTWTPALAEPILGVSCLIFGFLLYLFLILSPGIQKRLTESYDSEKASLYLTMINKWSGFVLLGVLPFALFPLLLDENPWQYGAGPITNPATWWWTLGIGGTLFTLQFFLGRGPAQYNTYPLIRYRSWSPGLLILSLVSSTVFLVGYEYMFRGVLLYTLLPVCGVWLTIALNVLIYSLAHIHKGLGETIGSVPFGILLCYITLTTGNIWAVLMIHLVLSLGTDVLSLGSNPEMRVKWK